MAVYPWWWVGNPQTIGTAAEYAEGEFFDVARCAFAAAQDAAVDHGGNTELTTVEGFSAGVHPAAWVGLGVLRDDPCPGAETAAPIGLVLGDSQWLFQGEPFEGAFGGESSQGIDTVDRFLNADRWTVPDGFVVSVGFLDNGLLQHLRMRQAGISVVHEQLPGDHSRSTGMIDRIIDVVWQVPLEDT